MATTGSKGSWKDYGSGLFQPVFSTKTALPPGVYTVENSNDGNLYFKLAKQFGDKVYDLPGLPNDFISSQIDKFWDAREIYDKYNFVHKRGILIYGPPGCGKTCVIAKLTENLVKAGGLVLCVGEFNLASKGLRQLKQLEPDRRVMTLMEDMDTLLSGDYKSEEPYALSMLDGQAQVNGVVHVATTNYPERIADRFIKRPGRFDLVIGLGSPMKETRRAYFQKILDDDKHPELNVLVEKTGGLSLAYLREIASSYLCLGIPIEETVGRLKKNFKSKIKAEDQAATMGFRLGYDERDHPKHRDED